MRQARDHSSSPRWSLLSRGAKPATEPARAGCVSEGETMTRFLLLVHPAGSVLAPRPVGAASLPDHLAPAAPVPASRHRGGRGAGPGRGGDHAAGAGARRPPLRVAPWRAPLPSGRQLGYHGKLSTGLASARTSSRFATLRADRAGQPDSPHGAPSGMFRFHPASARAAAIASGGSPSLRDSSSAT